MLHAVKEAHEVGEVLIPLYLSVHIGAVIAHSLAGRQVWQEMFFFKKSGLLKDQQQSVDENSYC